MRSKAGPRVLISALVLVHAAILFAGFISPYDPAAQDRDLSYAPPARIHFVDSAGFHLHPFTYATVRDFYGYREDHSREIPLRLFVKGDAYTLLWIFHCNTHLFGLDQPARLLLFGTDAYGRDEFSRLLYGGQISLAAGLIATFITLAAATIIGTLSGYYGRWIDEGLMGSAELFLCLPWFYFLVGVRAFLPLHVSPKETFLLLITVIGLIGWARPARLIRGIVLSARNRNHVLAARGFGASDFYLLRRHILPEAFAVLLPQATLLIPQYIAAEATLSFFGLGISEPVASWGNMLSTLQQYNVLLSYWWLMAPAGALIVTSVIYWRLADRMHYWLQSHSI
jgi:peptide/nickel transport system permease protein